MRPYLALQRALDQLGVFLRGAVAVAQFAVVAVAPAEDLALGGEGQRVAVRALGRRHLLDGAVRLEGQLLERRLVVGVAQAQAAVAPLAARPHRAVRGDDKGAVLARFDLQSRRGAKTTLGAVFTSCCPSWTTGELHNSSNLKSCLDEQKAAHSAPGLQPRA